MDDADESTVREFQSLLVDLSNRISDEELEMLKFYCEPLYVTRQRSEEISRVTDLWKALAEKDQICTNKTSFLKELFQKAIKRNDLIKAIVDYEQRPCGQHSTTRTSVDPG